jgi:SsrA-binding protein
MSMALIEHKKAYFNYEIIEKIEAGIELLGFEVKSVRAGKGSLDGAYITIDRGEAWLVSALVSPFQIGNTPAGYNERRTRKLLLNKAEVARLAGIAHEKGLTMVPIAMYNKGHKIKLEIGIARGKKKGDKRETIKKRESDREIERTLKNSK